MAGRDATVDAELAGQLPHWLFAFDAAGITLFRTLAVLASRPDLHRAVQDGVERSRMAWAQACLRETVRLWPTTLVVLRDVVRATELSGRPLPAGATVVVVSAWSHRDPRRPDADLFQPHDRLSGSRGSDDGLVPFSDGPARCPGESLVLQTAGAALLYFARSRWQLRAPRIGGRMPSMLNHYGIQLERAPNQARPPLETPPR